jgi:hypothetical protein
MIPRAIMTLPSFLIDVRLEDCPGPCLKASFSLHPSCFGVQGQSACASWRDTVVWRSRWVACRQTDGEMTEVGLLFRLQRVDVGMCGASRRSSSKAAYSQTLSGLAEGLSNNDITPLRDPLHRKPTPRGAVFDVLNTPGRGSAAGPCGRRLAGSTAPSVSRVNCAVAPPVPNTRVRAQVGLRRARARRTASSTIRWATSANLRCSAWLIARS